MSTQALVPVAFAGLIGWRIYRRVRRSIGRQPLQSGRAAFSVLMLSLVTVGIIGVSFRSSALLAGSAAGIGGGLLLGFLGLRLTTFESSEAGQFYIPNAHIGVALAVLLSARIAYRFVAIQSYTGGQLQRPASSPLTMLMAGLIIGYFLAYNTGLLLRSRSMLKTISR
jgi:hypothetical protein